MIPADLLARLREADHTLWDKYRSKEIIVSDKLVDQVQDAWLQACLQAAIQARLGWDLYQCNHHAADPHCRANIWVSDVRYDGKGPTEAEALLIAYLAAIEAMKG